MGVQFTNEMINSAIATEAKTGVPASITLGQLVLESGYKSPSNLSTLAKDYNNYFGVTKGSWKGETITLSNSAGQDTKVYRVYDSVTDGFLDHAKIFQAERYQKYFREAESIEDYAKGLQAGGYATDTQYANKLINVIKSNNLTQYDGKTDMYGVVNFGSTGTFDIEDYIEGGSGTGNSAIVLENELTSDNLGFWENILSTIVVFTVMFTICVVGVVSFMKAFNISIPSMKGMMKGGKNG